VEKANKALPTYSYSGPLRERHQIFPMVVDSSTVKGLNPGFWIVVMAIPTDEVIAKRFAQYLGKGAYHRKVAVESPEDIVVWISDNGNLFIGTPEVAKQVNAVTTGDIVAQRKAVLKRIADEDRAAEEAEKIRIREASEANDVRVERAQ
jgi:hypothetical protein